jgi:hypothetical protein
MICADARVSNISGINLFLRDYLVYFLLTLDFGSSFYESGWVYFEAEDCFGFEFLGGDYRRATTEAWIKEVGFFVDEGLEEVF